MEPPVQSERPTFVFKQILQRVVAKTLTWQYHPGDTAHTFRE